MGNDTAIAVAVHEAEDAVNPDATLQERLLAAMRATRRSWICTHEDGQFIAACEAVARSATEEERERIEEALGRMSKAAAMLAALSAGVPVDLAAIEAEELPENPLKLRALWDKSASEEAPA